MDFDLRDIEMADIERCVSHLASPFLCAPESHGALASMWSEIVTEGSGIAAIAFDRAGKTIIHFGVSVFVSDERADAYHRCAQPKIAQQMLSDWERGERPFLAADEIARANAGSGLNLVVAYYGGILSGGLPDERVYAADYESSRRVFRGWNLRSYTAEIFPHNEQRDGEKWGETLNFRVGTYSNDQLKEARIPFDRAPCVWMARREDAISSPSYALTLIFSLYAPPVFGFRRHEQRLLVLALDGRTDETIASITHISVPTVKKRWREIYGKVAGIAPSIPVLCGPLADGVRGVEARRHLLNYLRDHPEELRPYDATGAQRA
ncbi:MAG TPA: hypothetical protein VHS56_05940 [Candidatus Cybelea sp.]|nr:hypothetical protein [Candidatus Cybelea sp.]